MIHAVKAVLEITFNMKILSALAIILLIQTSNAEHLGDLPMQNPDLFEGDILGIRDIEDRNAIADERKRWPNGIIYYSIDDALKNYVSRLEQIMKDYEKHTCLKFKKRIDEEDYVRIFKGDGCYSHVGRFGGAQPLSLGEGCYYMGTMTHELGHAIGFGHEQNRSDRDDYITIIWENIEEGMENQFMKFTPFQNILYDEFNYESIMMYGSSAFSKDKKRLKTMIPKKEGVRLREVYEKRIPSPSDYYRINKLYKCKEFLKDE